MEPFRITCTTCKARLRVRAPDVIGQIVACPRCQSMVLVEAPPGDDPRGESKDGVSTGSGSGLQSSSGAVVESAEVSFGAIGNMLTGDAATSSGGTSPSGAQSRAQSSSRAKPAPGSPAEPAESNAAPSNSDSRWADPPPAQPGQRAPAEKTGRASSPQRRWPAVPGPADKQQTTSAPAKNPVTKKSDASSSKKQKAALAAAALVAAAPNVPATAAASDVAAAQLGAQASAAEATTASAAWTSPTELLWRKIALWGSASGVSLFVVGGLFGVWVARSGKKSQAPTQHTAAVSNVDPGSSSEPSDGTESEPKDDKETETSGVEGPSASSTDDSHEFEETVDESASSAVSSNVDDPSTAAPAQDTPVVQASPDKNATNENATKQQDDPIATIADSEASDIEKPEPAATPQGTSQVAEADETQKKNEQVEAPQPVGKPAAARHDPDPSEAWAPGDVAEKLETELGQVDFQSVALIDAVNFVSQVANVPITIDLFGLELQGVSPNATVSVQKENIKLAQMLRAALTPLELSYSVEDGQIRVTGRKARDTRVRQTKLAFDDLTGGETPEAIRLIEWIKKFVAPESWDVAGGPGVLETSGGQVRIQQTIAVHYQVIAFCERLRRARDLPPQSRMAPERFPLTSKRDQAKKTLDRPITFTFHQPTRLSQVTDFLEQTTGMTIVINWRSLIDTGFTPATLVSCAIQDQPLGEALSTTLQPLGLAWRAIDAQTIEILSPVDAAKAREVAFYKVADLAARGYDESRLQQLVARAVTVQRSDQSQLVGQAQQGDQAQQGERGADTLPVAALDPRSQCLLVLANQQDHQRIVASLSAAKRQ